jgi:hypothetical protein
MKDLMKSLGTLAIIVVGAFLIGKGAEVVGRAMAQSPGQILTSPVVVGGAFSFQGGPQSSAVRATGGTYTCTSAGTITVANTNVTANSIIVMTLKTVGGTVSTALYISTITVGTGFTVICGTSDTSVYNYLVLG